MERRQYSGNAPDTTLSSSIDATTLTISVTNGAGYPSGATGPFFIVIDRGLSTEEKIKCVSTVTNTITASLRGEDGTAQSSHSIGAAVEHVLTADDIDQFNQHAADVVDDHAQYARADGTRFPTTAHDLTGRHQFGAALGTPPAPADIGLTSSDPGSGATPGRYDHVHLLPAAIPRGTLNYVSSGTNMTLTQAAADVTGMSNTFTVASGPGSRRIKVTVHLYCSIGVQTAILATLNEGATVLRNDSIWNTDVASGFAGYMVFQYVVVPTAGAHTYKVQASYSSANPPVTNSVNFPSNPSWILVEDIGV